MKLGHVDLKVANLERAVRFYCDVLGFTVAEQSEEALVAFLRAEGDGAFHLALSVAESEGGSPPASHHTGLDYVALLYPDREALASAYRRLLDVQAPIERFDDHGVGESLYARDPDGNGLELYWERPAGDWPLEGGRLAMFTRPLDPDDLLARPSGI